MKYPMASTPANGTGLVFTSESDLIYLLLVTISFYGFGNSVNLKYVFPRATVHIPKIKMISAITENAPFELILIKSFRSLYKHILVYIIKTSIATYVYEKCANDKVDTSATNFNLKIQLRKKSIIWYNNCVITMKYAVTAASAINMVPPQYM